MKREVFIKVLMAGMLVFAVLASGCFEFNAEDPTDDYWTVYPEDHVNAGEPVPHPQLVHDHFSYGGVKVIVLFFWTQGCVPCAEQWEEMVQMDIASGPEDGGKEGAKYPSGFRLESIDAGSEKDLYGTYIPTGKETGVPMTTILFKKDGAIHWYSHYGKIETKDLDSMISSLIESI